MLHQIVDKVQEVITFNERRYMEHTYRISFKIGDSSFEIESTDLQWLKKKEKEYFQKLHTEFPKHKEKLQREGAEKPGATISRDLPTPDVTINEFFRRYIGQRQIKSRTTIAVFFIYYLQKVLKKGGINTGDVSDCFRHVSYPNWNKLNVTDILRRARSRALVNYFNNLWSLTTTGEDFVLNTITGKEG